MFRSIRLQNVEKGVVWNSLLEEPPSWDERSENIIKMVKDIPIPVEKETNPNHREKKKKRKTGGC